MAPMHNPPSSGPSQQRTVDSRTNIGDIEPPHRRVVVALGGNAITQPGDDGSVATDYANLKRSLRSVVDLVRRGYEVVVTHGNGPQVGNQMLRVELARGQAPDLPLDVMVADLQGGLGYMIERVLRNKLLRQGIDMPVCALLTLVEVSGDDPALHEPSKYVGQFYGQDEVETLVRERGWKMKEDKGRGWRRVVASPDPVAIVEKDLIVTLISSGALVIVTGGGGIPVRRDSAGLLKGVEAVIDKDLASSVLAAEIEASELFILTGVEQVALHFGTADEALLSSLTVEEARTYLAEGHFPVGSMGPKIEAACRFVENGGERALITDIFTLDQALAGRTGTWITAGSRSSPPRPGSGDAVATVA
ncbi:MAG: carbamate kinase [Thermoanaerobaculia bacterium]|nr:carbamate kinase [Thermoanaerobaculia bacterium]